MEEIKGYSHLITVKLTDFSVLPGDVVELMYSASNSPWYDSWHSNDDLNIQLNDDRTYGLKYFIGGIVDAYGGSNYIFKKRLNIR